MSSRWSFKPGSTLLALLAIPSLSSAEILVNLDPAAALYDSDVKGVVNDNGEGPTSASNRSGVPALGASHHALGYTFNIAFTPVSQDLTGTVLLIELGATSNGTGLYLVNGVPTLIGKQGSSDKGLPASLSDTALPEIAVQSEVGKLIPDTAYSISASWNHQGTLELKVKANGGEVVINQFAITGVAGDWSGNDTLGVATIGRNNLGGLSGSNAANEFGAPFDVDVTRRLNGAVSRALFWNAKAVTPLTPTAPIIRGFEVTRLPATNQLRFHWSVSEGQVAGHATAITIKSGGALVHSPVTLDGFTDLPDSAATDFTIEAVNDLGSVNAAATIAAETPWTQVVRGSSPVAWYRFNEKTGAGLIVDSATTPIPHDGKPTNTPVSGFSGFADGAARFPGNGGILTTLILNPGLVEAGFTVEAIIKRFPDELNGSRDIVTQRDLDGTGRGILNTHSNGRISSNLGLAVRKDADATLTADSWSHLVLVADAVNLELRWYLDGQWVGTSKDGLNPDGTTFDPNFLLEPSNGAWVIGAQKALNQNFLIGDLDEIAVYDYRLDDPDGDPLTTDSKVAIHRDAWWNLTKGLLEFSTAKSTVSSGQPTELVVRAGPDVTSVVVDQGVGPVTLVNGVGKITVSPAVSTTYQVTTISPAGTHTRSLAVTALQFQAPSIGGFAVTRLPGANKTRFHWKVSQGEAPNPTTITVRDGVTELHVSTTLSGFADVETAADSFTLEARNATGAVTATATVAAENGFAAAVRADAPVAWYRFNEAAGAGLIVDSAENAAPHNGAPVTTPVSGASGFIDGAARFDGAGGVLTNFILNPGDLETGFTIEAVVRRDPASGTGIRALVAQQDLNGTGRTIFQFTGDGLPSSGLAQAIRKDGDTNVRTGQWSHVALVADIINQEIRWYVDGVAAGTTKDGKNPDGSTFDPVFLLEPSGGAWTIGIHKNLLQNYFLGEIDDLAIYDKLLDDPNADANLADSRIAAHSDAWWSLTSGVLHLGTDVSSIEVGGSAVLSVRTGPDIQSITIDNGGGSHTPVNGNTTVTLQPTGTTTYQITLTGPGGSITRTVTVSLNAAPGVSLNVTAHSVQAGNLVVNFSGAASTTYAVKGSADLVSFNQDLGTVTTDAAGNGTVSLPIDPAKGSQFVRVQTIPAP